LIIRRSVIYMQTIFKMPILLLLSAFMLVARGAEETAVVNEGKINVRGQPSLVGEVVTQLQRGDQVTVLDYVKNDRAKAGEPTNWAKIKLPANTPVWCYSAMVKDGTVVATRLNLRGGPGDNYSVVGRLNKGDKISPIRTMGDWVEIEAPANTYAFVDASLIKHAGASGAKPAAPAVAMNRPETKPSKPLPANNSTAQREVATTQPPQQEKPPLTTPTQPQPSTQAQAEPQPTPETAAAVAEILGRPATPPPTTTQVPQTSTQVAETPAAKTQAALAKRIVRREGFVRPTRSIQAPTWYELVSPDTKKTINYLHEEKLGLKLKEYKGQKVIVSGEEAIDPRWPNTPILELETLDIAP